MKIKLAIIDSNRGYLDRLTQMFHVEYADKLEIFSFSDLSTALSTLSDARIEVILLSKEFELTQEMVGRRCGIAYFAENKEEETWKGLPTVFKYQKLELIYRQILSLYAEYASTSSQSFADASKTRLLWVTSFSGGVGTSSVAASCATAAAKMGKSVLYLDFDSNGSSSLFFDGEGAYTFTDVIYALKSRKSNLSLKLESSLRRSSQGVHFFASAETVLDMLELTQEEMIQLIEELRRVSVYDWIVIDAPWACDQKDHKLWKTAHQVLIVTGSSAVAMEKLKRTWQSLEIIDRNDSDFLLNRAALLCNCCLSRNTPSLSIEAPVVGALSVASAPNDRLLVDQLAQSDTLIRLMQGDGHGLRQ